MIYLQLFLAFLQIGAFSFGGGYAAMPLIQAQVIDHYAWLSASDFADLVTIAEMTPGPIAINAATFVGTQVAGIAGALAATIGVILPSMIFVSILALLYKKYRSLALMQGILASLRPAVVAMILSAGLAILLPTIFEGGILFSLAEGALRVVVGDLRIRAFLLFAGAFAVLRIWKPNPIYVMLGCGVVETIVQLIQKNM